MSRKEIEEQIIRQYQQDEHMMILVFAQWCVNHKLDPHELYQRAYPHQSQNPLLNQVMELTVSKEEAGDIDNETLIAVLTMYENDDLAYVVSQEMERIPKQKN
ncbi:hypothetical protein EEL32_00930 [Brevibacillus laterosporus]|uniref:Uncharacterized protein n=1 Tax=Brevibacillus laterosporus TaxID=1465 RepID=A0A502J2F9_BRELA|nr:hypothetical protein [Brevibacillus laterosporus]QDX94459.1 hypothetical protein EEL30_20535 [Brevibacillus laterosporus]RAP30988.1 hypothetical protein C2W64_00160 [Brevibacillus laterosporus]TPG68348.1 hypothetical protein EEL31_07290 [Brevibacillus laterosporus]TPG92965.1 hypothetical protein EEL32_00930 [Brevibacillus laterosporus]